MPPTFKTPIDFAETRLSAPRGAGAATLDVLDGSVFGDPTPDAPVRITVAAVASGAATFLIATARDANTLAVAVEDGYPDIDLAAGDPVAVTASGAALRDIHAAIIGVAGDLDAITLTPGDPGADGASAYQVAVAAGFAGTEIQWLASLVGQKGDQGDPGLPGDPGGPGPPGVVAAPAPLAYDADTRTISFVGPIAQSQVAGLGTALAGKAATVHAHAIADVTGLQTALDGKQAAGSYATAAQGTKADSAVQSISLATPNLLFSTPIAFAVAAGAATGTLALNTQAANTVLAGPTTGSAAVPTMRALVAADLPAHNHPVSQITATGTPSATTYLRGDGAWATPAGGGATLPTTTSLLRGDGAGGAVAATASDVPDLSATYPLLAGKAGGQTLRGGTAAGEVLALQSTAHATKGTITFNGGLASFNADCSVMVMPASFAIGGGTHGTLGSSATAIGNGAAATSLQATAIGGNAAAGDGGNAGEFGATAIGYGASCVGKSVAIGASSSATGTGATAIGQGTSAGSLAVAIGTSPTATGGGAVAVGLVANAGAAANALALGRATNASAGGIALGYGATTSGPADLAVAGQTLGSTGGLNVKLQGRSSAGSVATLATIQAAWADPTDATRKGQLTLAVADSTGTDKAGLRVQSDGTQALLGFYGAAAVARPSGDVLAALAALGLVASPTLPASTAGVPSDHKFDFPEGNAAVGIDQTTRAIVSRPATCRKVFLYASVAPTGADLIVDILRSSDGGTTWASLWATTPANRPKLVAGTKSGTATAFDTTALAEGDLLRFDLAQVGATVAGSGVIGLLSTTTGTL